MILEIATAISLAAADLGLEIEVREGYSGRGMYGATTTGLVYRSETDLLRAIALVAGTIAEEQGLDALDLFIEGLAELSTDDLGRQRIIY